MTVHAVRRLLLGLILVQIILGGQAVMAQSSRPLTNMPPGMEKIQHIVFIVKENRSFDQYFGAYWSWLNHGNPPPNPYFTTTGILSTGAIVPLGRTPDATPNDICHSWKCFIPMLDYGKMDHFDIEPTCVQNGGLMCLTQMQQPDIPNYWAYASNFTLSANFFSSIHGSSFPNHLYSISASSGGLIDQGLLNGGRAVGCESPQGGTADFLDENGNATKQFPCFDINTLGDLLTTAGVNWTSYAPPHIIFNAYTAINHIYNTDQWQQHVATYTNFATDAAAGKLPAVSWLVANGESEHPPFSACYGENWTVQQINAIMQGPDWPTTAIFLTWDESGGFYDHMSPPVEDVFGLGQRLPMIIISPYSIPGNISTTQYEHSSVLKFIEERFNLPSLNGRDVQANDMLDSFNFNQTPNPPLVLQTHSCPVIQASQNYQPQQVGTTSPTYAYTYVNTDPSKSDTILSVTASGDFTQSNACGTIFPGNYCTIESTFKPTASGPRSGVITITDRIGTGGNPQQRTVNLTGVGTYLAISPPGVLRFGAQKIGTTSAPLPLVITNSGTVPVKFSRVVVTGNFAQTNNCTTIPANGNCTMKVTFTPQTAGNLPGSITATDNDPSSPQTINLTGLGSSVTVAPTSLSFANQPLGTTSAVQGVTITNTSGSALSVSGLTIGGTYDTGDFAQKNNCPATLPVDGTCTAEVTFTPAFLGASAGPTYLVVNFAAADGPFSVGLAGTGVPSTSHPAPSVSQPLVPTSVAPGGSPFTLSVYGMNFVASSVVDFNGTPLSTVFKTARLLQATVPARLIATAGTASVTVATPAPGGGISNVAYLPITAPSSTLSFATQSMGVGVNPKGIVTADFNGDGIQDLAVANQGSNSVSVLLGNGDGTFTAGSSLTTGKQPGAIVSGDFNGDGRIDLAVADATDSRVLIFLGKGDGTFSAASPMNCNLITECASTVDPVALAVGDFNGDGHPDLAVVNQSISTVSLLFGAGDGTFSLQSTTQVALHESTAIAVGDFNGDGISDLALNNPASNTISILTGHPNGVFKSGGTITTTSPGMLVAADFNNDQKPDIAVLNPGSNTITLFFGNGNGTFQAGAHYDTGAGPSSILVGDFNGDGLLDIATANTGSNTVSVLLGTGGGIFATHLDTPAGGSPASITTGDFNGNGKLDLAVTDSTGNSISIFLQ